MTWQEGVADGVDEVRRAVRYQIKHGAQLIKICASGGVMSDSGAAGGMGIGRSCPAAPAVTGISP